MKKNLIISAHPNPAPFLHCNQLFKTIATMVNFYGQNFVIEVDGSGILAEFSIRNPLKKPLRILEEFLNQMPSANIAILK